MRSLPECSPALPATSNLPTVSAAPAAAAVPATAAAPERTAILTVVSQLRPRGIGGVPVLKLMGDWLAAVGFPTGTYVVLRAASGRIVIEAQGHLSQPGALDDRQRLRQSLQAS